MSHHNAPTQRHGSGGRQGGENFTVNTERLKKILDGKDPQDLVKLSEEIAKEHLVRGEKDSEKVSMSQIRNIFGTVKKLQMEPDKDKAAFRLVLLKPLLAYTVGRNKKCEGLKVLRDVLNNAIDLVWEEKTRFGNFCNFFEAMLAYHKFHLEEKKS